MLHTTIEATGDATTIGILQKKSGFNRLKLRIRNFVVIDQDQIETSHAEILAVILEVWIKKTIDRDYHDMDSIRIARCFCHSASSGF